MSELLLNALLIFIKVIVIQIILITCVAFVVYGERKISAYIQDRVGPNRVGPMGLLQSFIDVGKLLFKEDIVPEKADKFLHSLAPIISVTVSLAVIAVISAVTGLKNANELHTSSKEISDTTVNQLMLLH